MVICCWLACIGILEEFRLSELKSDSLTLVQSDMSDLGLSSTQGFLPLPLLSNAQHASIVPTVKFGDTLIRDSCTLGCLGIRACNDEARALARKRLYEGKILRVMYVF